MPVTEVKTMKSTSSGATPAASSASCSDAAASRVASPTNRSFVWPKVSAVRYCSRGSTRCRVATWAEEWMRRITACFRGSCVTIGASRSVISSCG